MLGIAAYAFPHDVDLDGTDVKIVEVAALDRFVRDAIERVLAVPGDPDTVDGQARKAAEVYRRTAAFKPKDRLPGRPVAAPSSRSWRCSAGWSSGARRGSCRRWAPCRSS